MAKASSTRKERDPVSSAPSAQPSPVAENAGDGRRPVHSIRYGGCEAAIWKNITDGRELYSVTLRKSWRDDKGEWHDGQTFLTSDLPMLAKTVTDAHSWIMWQQRQKGLKPTKGGGQ